MASSTCFTEEELMLLSKYDQLSKKKKAVEKYLQSKKKEQETAPVQIFQRDARQTRKMVSNLIKSGAISPIEKVPLRSDTTGFKKPSGIERKSNLSAYTFRPYVLRMPEKRVSPAFKEKHSEEGTSPRNVVKHSSLPKSTVNKTGHRTAVPRNTVHVSGFNLNHKTLQKAFSQYGRITVSLNSSESFGLVTFSDSSKVEVAIRELNGCVIGNTKLIVSHPDCDNLNRSTPSFRDATTWQDAASTYSQENSDDESRLPVSYSDVPSFSLE